MAESHEEWLLIVRMLWHTIKCDMGLILNLALSEVSRRPAEFGKEEGYFGAVNDVLSELGVEISIKEAVR